jgi:hypothetical protein
MNNEEDQFPASDLWIFEHMNRLESVVNLSFDLRTVDENINVCGQHWSRRRRAADILPAARHRHLTGGASPTSYRQRGVAHYFWPSRRRYSLIDAVPGSSQDHVATTLPIHAKVILKQHRNFVTTYKLSDVSQEWQLRVRYHFSLSLLLAHQLRSVKSFHYPRIFRDFSKNLAKNGAAKFVWA